MSEKKNIDRLFQEKFKDFEPEPSPMIWNAIEARLKEKKKRRVIPIWFRYAGVAAILLIGFLIYQRSQSPGILNNPDQVVFEQNAAKDHSDSEQTINSAKGSESEANSAQREAIGESSDKILNPETENTDKVASAADNDNSDRNSANGEKGSNKVNSSKSALTNVAVKSHNNAAIASTQKSNIKHKNRKQIISEKKNQDVAAVTKTDDGNAINSDLNKHIEDNQKTNPIINQNAFDKKSPENNTIAANKNGVDDKKTDSTAIATAEPNALEELLNEKENKTVTKGEPKVNRWQISSNVAPIYFSSTSTGSPIDSRLAQNNKDYKADLSYGVGVRYALNQKFTVRAGVNTIGMEYNTNDLTFVQTQHARALQNVSTNIQGSMIQIEGKTQPSELATNNVSDGRKFSSILSQRTGYIEVPVELSYKIIDKKFGIEVIGGVSTLFLNENSVSLLSSGLDMEIGEATNLSNTHFSTNLGLGMRYNFLKSFQVNLEPMFKYQINTYSDTAKYNPYMFGLYTGVTYRF